MKHTLWRGARRAAEETTRRAERRERRPPREQSSRVRAPPPGGTPHPPREGARQRVKERVSASEHNNWRVPKGGSPYLHVRSFAPRPQTCVAQQRHARRVERRRRGASVAPEPSDVAASGGGVEQLRAQTRRREVRDATGDVGCAYSAQRGQRKPLRKRLLKRHEPAAALAVGAERGAGLSCVDKVATCDAVGRIFPSS